MCAVSMIMDHYSYKWQQLPYTTYTPYTTPQISPEEVEEFHRLLDRAREYDRRTGQPDCELDWKKDQVKKLAEKLGVKIDFL